MIGWNLSKKREIGYTSLSIKKQKITNLSKTFQLSSSSCTVNSVNGANANGMKFSGISTGSVNIFQSRTVQQALKAAWRSATLVKKAIFTINVLKSNEVIKFPASSRWIKEWCFYFEHIIEFGMHISGLIEPGQAQATWLFYCMRATLISMEEDTLLVCRKTGEDSNPANYAYLLLLATLRKEKLYLMLKTKGRFYFSSRNPLKDRLEKVLGKQMGRWNHDGSCELQLTRGGNFS